MELQRGHIDEADRQVTQRRIESATAQRYLSHRQAAIVMSSRTTDSMKTASIFNPDSKYLSSKQTHFEFKPSSNIPSSTYNDTEGYMNKKIIYNEGGARVYDASDEEFDIPVSISSNRSRKDSNAFNHQSYPAYPYNNQGKGDDKSTNILLPTSTKVSTSKSSGTNVMGSSTNGNNKDSSPSASSDTSIHKYNHITKNTTPTFNNYTINLPLNYRHQQALENHAVNEAKNVLITARNQWNFTNNQRIQANKFIEEEKEFLTNLIKPTTTASWFT